MMNSDQDGSGRIFRFWEAEVDCRTIEETEVLRLSAEDQRLFAEAILNPPAPNAALRRAERRRRELFGE